MKKERLNLGDDIMIAMMKMSDGNPGAAVSLMQIVKEAANIDPDSALGAYGPLLSLDSMGIYGTDIYILFSDICDKDVVKFLAVIRACQLGLFDGEIVKDAASRQDRTGKALIPLEDIYTKVKERLPNFNAIVSQTV